MLPLVPTGSTYPFQSSPPPKERCNVGASPRSRRHISPFNPHRPRRSGAISTPHNSLFLPDLQGGFRRPLRTES